MPAVPERDPQFSRFFSATYHETLGLVTLSCGNVALAEEVTQEAFARALHRWDSVSGMARPDRWVLKVASNLVIDHVRKTRRETSLHPSLAAAHIDEIEQIWMQHNLDCLTPMQRRAMLLHYRDGMRIAEIATMAGRSVETIRTHLRLGRMRLRELSLAGE